MAGEASHQRRLASGFSIIYIGIVGAFVTIAMPGILLSISQELALSASSTAQFATTELGCMVISTVIVGRRLASPSRKQLILSALILICVGNIGSIALMHSEYLIVMRGLCGLGEGVCLAAMGAAAAQRANPDRLFALLISFNMLMVTLFMATLTSVLDLGGLKSVLAILGLMSAIGLIALPFFPNWTAEAQSLSRAAPIDERACPKRGTAIFGLVAWFCFSVGTGVVWPLMGQIGMTRGISSQLVSTALGAATVGGILAGLSVALIGVRFGRRVPLLAAGSALIATMLALTSQWAGFTQCAVAFMFYWVVASAYFMGTIAAADPTGKVGTFTAATQQAGLALGPLMATILMQNGSYSLPIMAGAFACLIALMLATFVESQATSLSNVKLRPFSNHYP